ncbi:glycosyltransferase family 2 protein [Pseudoflavitalea rhizosphaerae]|uniref:glycosyltransferase family 2 protein n=1 Tax=Pseudoflavitalea rhizosphaerae TaxID=1884793 RepID=UPI000F8EA130|nr:glycosyltransferase family A protein [Pseudoflavitalea rhizosphaerae]
MTDQPLVSVLMTSYNRQKYIGAAIDSVLASSYTNLELIIVDDGSKDDTVAIARNYAAKDNRVKVFINEKNLGDYGNRNQAAAYASGKYLKYVDADDYIYPWGLGLLVQMMEQYPEAGWGLCSLPQEDDRPYPFLLSPAEAYEYHYSRFSIFFKAPLSAIIKRSAFDEIGGFRPIRMAGDFDMWHRMAQKFPVVLMPHGMVWYRKHGEQEMNHAKQFFHVYEKLKVEYLTTNDCPLAPSKAREFLKREKRKTWKSILKNMASLRLNDALLDLKKIKQHSAS